MEAERKKTKVEEKYLDRISNLPDFLVHHILSFLNAKYAVQTCVLSKRWRYIWNGIPYLRLHAEPFKFNFKAFDRFVKELLSRIGDGGCTNSVYHLSFSQRGNNEQLLKRVISFVELNQIQCLEFQSTQLIRKYLNVPLLSLTTLCLSNVQFHGRSDYWHLNFFSSFPNLENLSIIGCSLNTTIYTFEISAPHLASLTIRSTYFGDCTVVVSAPELTHFCIEASLPFSLSVVRTHILLLEFDIDVNEFDVRVWTKNEGLINMLKELHGVQSLQLSMNVVKLLSMDPGLLEFRPSPFHDLKSLKFKATPECRFIDVPEFVMNYFHGGSPCAEIIHL